MWPCRFHPGILFMVVSRMGQVQALNWVHWLCGGKGGCCRFLRRKCCGCGGILFIPIWKRELLNFLIPRHPYRRGNSTRNFCVLEFSEPGLYSTPGQSEEHMIYGIEASRSGRSQH